MTKQDLLDGKPFFIDGNLFVFKQKNGFLNYIAGVHSFIDEYQDEYFVIAKFPFDNKRIYFCNCRLKTT